MLAEAVRSLLLREMGTLTYRERIYLKEHLDARFIDEELRRLSQRILRMRWVWVGCWTAFVSLLFLWVKFNVFVPTVSAALLFLTFTAATALTAHIERLRRRVLIFRVFRRLVQHHSNALNLDESDFSD